MTQTSSADVLVNDSIAIVRSRFAEVPTAAIILGSGLGDLADEITDAVVCDYDELPGFAKSTASGHRGQLIGGKLAGVSIVAMAGRFHRYEGYSDADVTFPVRVMAGLGAKLMIVSNAAGGLNPSLSVGDIVVLRDHIDLARSRSLLLEHVTEKTIAGELLTDRTCICRSREIYDVKLRELALNAARRADFHATLGVYLATLGPTYETRAEYRMMRSFGADVVGMSTAPEVRVANLLGMRVLALSMVSNIAKPDADVAAVASHSEVLAAGRSAAFKLRAIVETVLRSSDW